MSKFLNLAPFVIISVSIFGGLFKDGLKMIPGIVYILWGGIGLYLGIYFWFLSDPRIVWKEE